MARELPLKETLMWRLPQFFRHYLRDERRETTKENGKAKQKNELSFASI
jgi:hypothetical protein